MSVSPRVSPTPALTAGMYQSLISYPSINCPNDDGDCHAACGEQFNARLFPAAAPDGQRRLFPNQCLNECDDDDRVCTDKIRQTSPAATMSSSRQLTAQNELPDDGDCRLMHAMEIAPASDRWLCPWVI